METEREIATLPPSDEIELVDMRLDVKNVVNSAIEMMKKQEDKLLGSQSEDIAHSTYEFERLKMAEISCCVLAFVGLSCGAISYDLEYVLEIYEEKKDRELAVVMISGTVSTFLLLVAICWRTIRELRWLQAKCLLSNQDDLLTTRKVNELVLELLVNLPHPIYWLNRAEFSFYNAVKDATIQYTYNSWLTVWTLVRVYHIIKVVSVLSHFRNGRAQRVCHMNGTYPGSWFAVRCLMRDLPYHVLAAILLGGMLIGSFLIRVFERPMVSYTGKDFSDYGNSMWYVLVTMTTVGYGELYPVTLLGRISGILVCFWGVITLSMIVVAVTAMMNLDSSEGKALLIIQRLAFKDDLKQMAAYVLTSAFQYRWLLKHCPTDRDRLELQLGRFQKHLTVFQSARNQSRGLYDLDSYCDRVERKARMVEEDIIEMKSQLTKIHAMISQALQGKQSLDRPDSATGDLDNGSSFDGR